MKKIISATLVFVFIAALFTGCSKSNSGNTLKLGLDASFPPMGFTDSKGNIVGFDIDVAKEVCSRIGYTLKTQPIDWNMKDTELNKGNIDCIWNGLSVTPERQQSFLLSDSYMKNNQVLVVLKDSAYQSIDDLKGNTIGLQEGSTAEGALNAATTFKDSIKNSITYKDNELALQDLSNKGIVAVLMDEVVANYIITDQQKNYRVLSGSLSEEEYAIAFRKGDTALRDKIQNAINDMAKDGKLAEISTKWFGKDVTIIGK